MPGRPSSDMNIARVHGVAELAASIATTWGTSEFFIGRILVTGSAGARRARDIRRSAAATAARRLTSASGRRA